MLGQSWVEDALSPNNWDIGHVRHLTPLRLGRANISQLEKVVEKSSTIDNNLEFLNFMKGYDINNSVFAT